MLLVSAKLTSKAAISALFLLPHMLCLKFWTFLIQKVFRNIFFLFSFTERCNVYKVTCEERWIGRLLIFS